MHHGNELTLARRDHVSACYAQNRPLWSTGHCRGSGTFRRMAAAQPDIVFYTGAVPAVSL